MPSDIWPSGPGCWAGGRSGWATRWSSTTSANVDVARSPNDHLAFGQGPHLCLGAAFARLQMQAFFGELLEVGELRLDGEPRRLTSNFINGLISLPVRI